MLEFKFAGYFTSARLNKKFFTLFRKYGGPTGKKKGRKRKFDFKDYGMGYDETDPFVDNSEACDEVGFRCMKQLLNMYRQLEWIVTDGVNRDSGLSQETFCLCLSRLEPRVPINPVNLNPPWSTAFNTLYSIWTD